MLSNVKSNNSKKIRLKLKLNIKFVSFIPYTYGRLHRSVTVRVDNFITKAQFVDSVSADNEPPQRALISFYTTIYWGRRDISHSLHFSKVL